MFVLFWLPNDIVGASLDPFLTTLRHNFGASELTLGDFGFYFEGGVTIKRNHEDLVTSTGVLQGTFRNAYHPVLLFWYFCSSHSSEKLFGECL